MLCQKGAIPCAICFTHVFLCFSPFSRSSFYPHDFPHRFHCIVWFCTFNIALPSLHILLYLIIQGNEQPTFTSFRCERILIRDIIHAFCTWAHYWGGESSRALRSICITRTHIVLCVHCRSGKGAIKSKLMTFYMSNKGKHFTQFGLCFLFS